MSSYQACYRHAKWEWNDHGAHVVDVSCSEKV